MRHHEETAVSTDVNTGRIRSGQLGTQNTAYTEAHGRKAAGRKVSSPYLGAPEFLDPRLVVADIREHDGVFWRHLAYIKNQPSGVNRVRI